MNIIKDIDEVLDCIDINNDNEGLENIIGYEINMLSEKENNSYDYILDLLFNCLSNEIIDSNWEIEKNRRQANLEMLKQIIFRYEHIHNLLCMIHNDNIVFYRTIH